MTHKSFFFGLLFGVLASITFAINVDYKNPVFIPEKGVITQTMILTNSSKKPHAVEIFSRPREYTIDGDEKESELTEDFLIYPEQVIIPPYSEEVVTITWIKDGPVKHELAYRVIVEQVPIPTEKEMRDGPSGGIHTVQKYVLKTYVQPKRAKAKIKLSRAERIAKDGKEFLELQFENIGTKHHYLKVNNIIFHTKKGKKKFSPNRFRRKVILLANDKRRIYVPWGKTYPESYQKVTFTGD